MEDTILAPTCPVYMREEVLTIQAVLSASPLYGLSEPPRSAYWSKAHLSPSKERRVNDDDHQVNLPCYGLVHRPLFTGIRESQNIKGQAFLDSYTGLTRNKDSIILIQRLISYNYFTTANTMKGLQNLLLFIPAVTAGYVQLCSSDGQCADTGDANSNTNLGPVGGKPPFTMVAHDVEPTIMSLFDSTCGEGSTGYLETCDDCTSITTGENGKICF